MTPEQRRERDRRINHDNALIRLKSPFYQGLAATAYAEDKPEYGNLVKMARAESLNHFKRSVQGRDNQLAYDEIIGPMLERDRGSERVATSLILRSLDDITLGDYMTLMGYEVDDEHKQTPMKNLKKKERAEKAEKFLARITHDSIRRYLAFLDASNMEDDRRRYSPQPSESSE